MSRKLSKPAFPEALASPSDLVQTPKGQMSSNNQRQKRKRVHEAKEVKEVFLCWNRVDGVTVSSLFTP
jgi:hypothetical protein